MHSSDYWFLSGIRSFNYHPHHLLASNGFPFLSPVATSVLYRDVSAFSGPSAGFFVRSLVLPPYSNSISTIQATTTHLNYSRIQLLRLKSKSPIPPNVFNTLKDLGILNTRRTRAGVRYKQKSWPISSIISNRSVLPTVSSNNNISTPLLLPFSPSLDKPAKICLFNARLVYNKPSYIHDFTIDNDVDIICLTETWLKSENVNNQSVINKLTPNGYVFKHVARAGRGGGVGFLYKKTLKIGQISLDKFKSFEIMGMSVNSFPSISIFIINRPPSSGRNNISTSLFFEEFSTFLENFCTTSSSVLLVGDFNFHINDSSNVDATKFLNLLEIFNLAQHVDQPTYQNKQILDLVITKVSHTILSNVIVSDPAISEHCAVFGTLQIKKPSFEKIISKFRNVKRGVNLNNLSIPPRLPLHPSIEKTAKICHLNARSVCNKPTVINDFTVENSIDILCLTETWLKSNSQEVINELTPKGYIFHHISRKTRGGGVGILFKKIIKS